MLDAYILNYGAFFFACWAGYKTGTTVFENTNSKGMGWAAGVAVWFACTVVVAFFIPALPGGDGIDWSERCC